MTLQRSLSSVPASDQEVIRSLILSALLGEGRSVNFRYAEYEFTLDFEIDTKVDESASFFPVIVHVSGDVPHEG